jgi:hypothetical protein
VGDRLKDPGTNGIILKWIFNKQDGRVVDWIDMSQDRDRRRALVNAVMNLQVAKKCGEILD